MENEVREFYNKYGIREWNRLEENLYSMIKTVHIPTAKFELKDLFAELMRRNVEIRIVDNIWDITDKVKNSTLNWSLCRMSYTQPRL